MTDIESMILKEAHRQGVVPNADAVRQAGIDLAGAVLTSDGLISLPGRGSISPADFTRSLRRAIPEGFAPVTDKPATSDQRQPHETLTAFMRRLADAGRKQHQLPHDWEQVRSKYIGLTASMMDQIKKEKYGK